MATNTKNGQLHVLVAEDEVSNYLFLEEVLQEMGAALYWAKNGNEVLDILDQNPGINMILMDIKMPELNGLEVTKIIKNKYKDIPIIAQTAYAMEEDKEKCLQAGCDEYISKPIDINELTGILNKFINK
jgi:CheY-like chemotaxis protein